MFSLFKKFNDEQISGLFRYPPSPVKAVATATSVFSEFIFCQISVKNFSVIRELQNQNIFSSGTELADGRYWICNE